MNVMTDESGNVLIADDATALVIEGIESVTAGATHKDDVHGETIECGYSFKLPWYASKRTREAKLVEAGKYIGELAAYGTGYNGSNLRVTAVKKWYGTIIVTVTCNIYDVVKRDD